MMNFLDRFFGKNKDQRSAKRAMERLRFVLVTDRSNLTPEQLRQMQAEIVEVIKKYCRVDEAAVDIKLEQRERENYLVADIPLAKDPHNPQEQGGSIGFSLQTFPVPSVVEDTEAKPSE
jgi:cell division topological specificity factor